MILDDILKEKRAERKRLAAQVATLDKQIKQLESEKKKPAKPKAVGKAKPKPTKK